jgi:hypothetical protein
MDTNPIPEAGREFRPKPSIPAAVSAVAFTLGLGGLSVFVIWAALTDLDGSFRHPGGRNIPGCSFNERQLAFAIVFGGMSVSMTLFSGWLVLATFRHRLFVNAEVVRARGIVSTHEVRIADVKNLVWRSPVASGSVALSDGRDRLMIYFGLYEKPERAETIQYLPNDVRRSHQRRLGAFRTPMGPRSCELRIVSGGKSERDAHDRDLVHERSSVSLHDS